jgi:hypothetical protein
MDVPEKERTVPGVGYTTTWRAVWEMYSYLYIPQAIIVQIICSR